MSKRKSKKSKNTTLIVFLVITFIIAIALLLYFFLWKENYGEISENMTTGGQGKGYEEKCMDAGNYKCKGNFTCAAKDEQGKGRCKCPENKTHFSELTKDQKQFFNEDECIPKNALDDLGEQEGCEQLFDGTWATNPENDDDAKCVKDTIPNNNFRKFTGIRGSEQQFRFIYNDDGYWKSEFWTGNWEDYSQDSKTAKYDLISIENINTSNQKVFLKSQSSNKKAFLDGEKGIIRIGTDTGNLGLKQMKSRDPISEEERIKNCKWS